MNEPPWTSHCTRSFSSWKVLLHISSELPLNLTSLLCGIFHPQLCNLLSNRCPEKLCREVFQLIPYEFRRPWWGLVRWKCPRWFSTKFTKFNENSNNMFNSYAFLHEVSHILIFIRLDDLLYRFGFTEWFSATALRELLVFKYICEFSVNKIFSPHQAFLPGVFHSLEKAHCAENHKYS